MNTIIIPQHALKLIKESEDEVTFFEFFTNVKDFIKDLLEDPINARPNEFFTKHGIGNGKLRGMLIDSDIIVKNENIDEPMDEENGEPKSVYYLSFKVPKNNFKRKIKRLYQHTFES